MIDVSSKKDIKYGNFRYCPKCRSGSLALYTQVSQYIDRRSGQLQFKLWFNVDIEESTAKSLGYYKYKGLWENRVLEQDLERIWRYMLMNKVILIGRLTRDPDIRYTQAAEPLAIARYTLAVDRRFQKRDNSGNDQNADFIPCVAFGKLGEFAEKYLKQGIKIAITGRIQTGSYTNRDGQKVYTTDVVVEECEFAESKKNSDNSDYQMPDRPVPANANADGFMNIPSDLASSLPFK